MTDQATAVLVDLDGTLCDTSGRAHLLDKKPRDWEAYSLACGDDKPIPFAIEVVQDLADRGHRIVISTGRGIVARKQTNAWLLRNGVPWHTIFMRKVGDMRRNPELKRERAEQVMRESRVLFALEDHPAVVREYAALGIPSLVVARPEADQGILTELAADLVDQSANAQLPAPVAEALTLIHDTFARKNADYAQDTNWRSNFDDVSGQMGWESSVTAADALIAVKQARLRSLKANGRGPANEAVLDTYLDRTVYAVIALALYLDEQSQQQ